MKKTHFVCVLAICMSFAYIAGAKPVNTEIPYVDAYKKINSAVDAPAVMADVMKSLSASNQVTFLGDVNTAISRIPGSAESRTAMFLNVDSAALRSAESGNLLNLIAEVFATVQISALPALCECFSENLFSRDYHMISDEEYVAAVRRVMNAVNARVSKCCDGDVRSAFVAFMFIKASSASNDVIFKSIVDMVPENSRSAATWTWLHEALGIGGKPASFDTMLAVANCGVISDIVRTLEIAGPQFHVVLLSDLTGFNTEPTVRVSEHTPITDAIFNVHYLGRPFDDMPNPYVQDDVHIPPVLPARTCCCPEPRPYDGQCIR